MAYILAGAIQSRFINPATGALMFTTKTLQESTFGISVTGEDVRGGLSNPLLGKYFHDSIMDVTMTDALFDLSYIAAQVGGQIIIGGDAVTDESITTVALNTITVTNTPVEWNGVGVIGWYTIAGQDNWQLITFTGKNATVSNLPIGSQVCVRYISVNDAAKTFTVPASIIPAECYLEVEGALFNANSKTFTQSSRAGSLFVEVPRFLFNGTVDLAMSATGASTTNLSGTALAYYNTTSCDNLGSYAKVTQVITGAVWDTDLIGMAVDDAEFTLAVNGTHAITTYGVFKGGATGTIDPANLTYSVTPTSVGTIAGNVFTAAATGDAVIEITDTNTPAIVCYANVTVQ